LVSVADAAESHQELARLHHALDRLNLRNLG
jgi:hypothetical protein